MASKRRLRRKGCGIKRKYATADEARAAVAEMTARGRITQVAYPCEWCGSFHTAHPKFYD